MTGTLRRLWPAGLLVCGVACFDVTPSAERNQMVILAPLEIRDSFDVSLARFFSASSNAPSRARYGYSPEMSRRAIDGEVDILITTHPLWGDYVQERTDIVARGSIGTDRLVVVGRPGASLDGPRDLTWLTDSSLGRLAVSSMESDSVGMYAREALLRYGIWSQVQSSLEILPSSAAVIGAVTTGAVDAAILLARTAAEARLPVMFEFDPAFHRPIRFEALLLSEQHPQARALYESLVRGAGLVPGSTRTSTGRR